MIENINYTGIVNSPDDYSSSNGELSVMIDAVNYKGQIKPFIHPRPFTTIIGTLCCVHKGSGYENIITVHSGSLYSQPKGGSRVMITSNIGTVRKVEVIGNTLIVIADEWVKYLLYKDNNYVYLGEKPPMPDVKFTVVPDANAISNYSESDIGKSIPNEGYVITESDYIMITNATHGALNQFISKSKDGNYICFPCYLRYALRLYDGTVINHSAPILLENNNETLILIGHEISDYENAFAFLSAGNNTTWVRGFTSRYTLKMNWGGYNQGWSDIVKSIDVFLSAPVYSYDVSANIKELYPYYPLMGRYVKLPMFSNDKIYKDIADTSLFYKIFSIPTSGKFKAFNNQDASLPFVAENFNSLLPSKIMHNLQLQERMDDDYRSHHNIAVKASYIYNSRLHIANITTRLFSGFDLLKMVSKDAAAEAVPHSYFDVTTYINLGNKTAIVKNSLGAVKFSRADIIQYVFYPDARAYRMVIEFGGGSWGETASVVNMRATLDLAEHPYLNGAYYLADNLSGIPIEPVEERLSETIYNIDITPNRLQVSEVNNPFVFRALQSYTVGTGEIVAIASATKALSQGQFGQFPLYVFSSEGIWSMEVSATGTYASKQMTSRDVCNNGDSVAQLDGAVAFTSDRGVMVLQGSDVVCISSVLDGHTFNAADIHNIDDVFTSSGTVALGALIKSAVPFKEFLRGCRIAYDYPNSRLLLLNNTQQYNYVFNIDTKGWSMVSRNYVNVTNNFPYSYLTDSEGNVSNLSAIISPDDPEVVKSVLLTRPLYLQDSSLLKTVRTVLHDGQKLTPGTISSVLFGSRDGVRFTPIASSRERFIRRIHGTPYKSFRLMVVTDMSQRSSLVGSSIEFENKFVNKLR